MSLTSPRQLPGRQAPSPRPDLEDLLLEAARFRHRQDCLYWIQRCVHRRGIRWLTDFQTHTLPAQAGADAAAWLAAVLGDGPLERDDSPTPAADESAAEFIPAGDFRLVQATLEISREPDDRAWIEQRATAAVDGAIAAMLTEFPELSLTSIPRLGLTVPLPVMPMPPEPLVPDVLPGRQHTPVFCLSNSHADAVVNAIEDHAIENHADSLPGDGSHAVGSDGVAPVQINGPSVVPQDPDPLDGLSEESAARWQRTAARPSSGLGSRLLRRFTQTDWRALTRRRLDPAAERAGLEQPRHGEIEAMASPVLEASPESLPCSLEEQFSLVQECPVLQELPSPEAGQAPEAIPATGLEPHISGAGRRDSSPDPLAQVVRLAERHRGQQQLNDAAPVPPALADLRAWLPEADLPRAS